MEFEESLKFAQERLDKISYHLEMTNNLPCRSFYEKQQEMLVYAVAALRVQAEREKAPKSNFQRHFGTPERVAEFLDKHINDCEDCPLHVECNMEGACKPRFLDWLNAPAEDGK